MRESFEYIKNQNKIAIEKSYCEDNDLEFKIISEKDLVNIVPIKVENAKLVVIKCQH